MHRMVEVTVDRDRVVFEIEGRDKLWSLRSRLEIPLAHMTGVEAKPDQVNPCRACSPQGRFTTTASWFFGTCAIPPIRSSYRSITSDTGS